MLHVASFCTFGISREPRTSRSHVIRALPSSSRFNRGSCFTARVFSTLKHNPTFEKKYGVSELFSLVIIEFYFKKIKKRYFEDNFWAKIEISGWMKTNMAATSYHPRILSPKYRQTGNVKPLTANCSLSFAVKWPNLDHKVSVVKFQAAKNLAINHLPLEGDAKLTVRYWSRFTSWRSQFLGNAEKPRSVRS